MPPQRMLRFCHAVEVFVHIDLGGKRVPPTACSACRGQAFQNPRVLGLDGFIENKYLANTEDLAAKVFGIHGIVLWVRLFTPEKSVAADPPQDGLLGRHPLRPEAGERQK